MRTKRVRGINLYSITPIGMLAIDGIDVWYVCWLFFFLTALVVIAIAAVVVVVIFLVIMQMRLIALMVLSGYGSVAVCYGDK